MLRFFRSRSRGRRKEEQDDTWSPFPSSPETSRNRPVRATRVTRHGANDPDEDDQPQSPRHAMPSLFFRNYRETTHNAIEHEEEHDIAANHHHDEDEDEDEDEDNSDEDEDAVDAPLLPIFSAAHLDKLPLYNVTHAVRLLIVQRCETTLSWDQLRSPQISQFLVKPIQNQIRADHFNRATLCALIANSLQFRKEGQVTPGNIGVLRTRALISELLAMRLLREFSSRELIDALSYDFDPLQGMIPPVATTVRPGRSHPVSQHADVQAQRAISKGVRVSTIEIAIRAEAKRFLAHPLVVQHLEAIWAGNIVFHSKADTLHRKNRPPRPTARGHSTGYGTIDRDARAVPHINARLRADRARDDRTLDHLFPRRTATLYNYRYASLFKLSRLRVPRYRQVFSTLSFATMLALFLAVLVDRSIEITPLELLFWFWSAGYMLDEVVGFTEQGFGLYLLSFWNAFDLGILLLFATYYCLRLYSVFLRGDSKLQVAGIAYDVLASTAILLFPRLFSILDHYRYFSQLLIAFRLMTQDLIAILVLILISTSGFFVAFTFGMSKTETDPVDVAYALFQIVMGFTPAAWDRWSSFNILGQLLLGGFLIMCHFLIVTILITVLTNSFMAIVKNAEEEHQFLFAINTISMVKSDALFSYIAPSNVIGWVLSPLRYIIPFRVYVKFNRTIIKITHCPVLFIIFAYERLIMATSVIDPAEVLDNQPKKRTEPIAFSLNKPPELFSPGVKFKEPSLIGFSKEQALDEVFRRPFRGDTLRTTTPGMDGERRGSSTAVDKWMQAAENEGGASPPLEQPRSVLERLEHRRPGHRRAMTADRLRLLRKSRDFSTATKSVASDPDVISPFSARKSFRIEEEPERLERSVENIPQETDADGDDEINEHSDHQLPGLDESAISLPPPGAKRNSDEGDVDYFGTRATARLPLIHLPNGGPPRPAAKTKITTPGEKIAPPAKTSSRKDNSRTISNGTVLFAPRPGPQRLRSTDVIASRSSNAKHTIDSNNGAGDTPPGILLPIERPSKAKDARPSKARPSVPIRHTTAPGLTFLEHPRRPSLNARGLDLASEIGDNRWGHSGLTDAGGIASMPGSFSEQLMRERDRQRRVEDERRRSAEDEEKGMVNRILLNRMATMEEGFREVLREVRELSSQAANTASRRDSDVDSIPGFMAIHPPRGSVANAAGRRSRGETGPSSLSASAHTPNKTLIGRIGGTDRGKGKSPRKNSGRKEGKRKVDGMSKIETNEDEPLTGRENAEQVMMQSSPASVRSVMGYGDETTEQSAANPSTAKKEEKLMTLQGMSEQERENNK